MINTLIDSFYGEQYYGNYSSSNLYRPSVDVEFHPPAFLDFYTDPELHAYIKATYVDTGMIDLTKTNAGPSDNGILSEDGLSSKIIVCFTSEQARNEYVSDSKILLNSPVVQEHRVKNGITFTVAVNDVVIMQSS